MGASETPPFWWDKPGLRALALAPAAAAFASLARRRVGSKSRISVDVPVLLIADFAVSVPGKSQTAMAFARAARDLGHRPGIVCAAPAGAGQAPHLIDVTHDTPRHVGDAALEMAGSAPVAVGADRAAAARLLAAEGCDLLLLVDGGLRQPIDAHFTLLVVDARLGLGNERVMPAGPLRCSLTDRVRSADAVLRIGDGTGGNSAVRAAARAARPVYEARAVFSGLASKVPVLAFTAVKDPNGFFEAVSGTGAEIAATRTFAEGHYFSPDELDELLADAVAADARLLTSRRDAIRLAGGEAPPDGFMERLEILDMAVEFEVDSTAPAIVAQTIDNWRAGRAR